MLTLYVKTGCAYCAAVVAKLHDEDIAYKEKNVAEPGVVEEMIEKGGKKQEPMLVDDASGIVMYESRDIIRYLDEHYGDGSGAASPTPEDTAGAGPSVCPVE